MRETLTLSVTPASQCSETTTKCWKDGSLAFLTGMVRHQMWNKDHSGDCWRHASMTPALWPPQMTGHVWRKSPSKTKTFPPNGRSFSVTLWRMQAKTALFAIGASSQRIRAASQSNSARLSARWIEDSRSSFISLTGTWAEVGRASDCREMNAYLESSMCCPTSQEELCCKSRGGGSQDYFMASPCSITASIDEKCFSCTCRSIYERL